MLLVLTSCLAKKQRVSPPHTSIPNKLGGVIALFFSKKGKEEAFYDRDTKCVLIRLLDRCCFFLIYELQIMKRNKVDSFQEEMFEFI
jgi:hypothetical protein